MQDEGGPEVVRRLRLLDRKLNFIAGLLIAGVACSVGLVVGVIAYYLAGMVAAGIAGFIAAAVAGKLTERPFQKADP